MLKCGTAALVWIWLMIGAALADGLHNAPFVLQDVKLAQRTGKIVTVSLKIENLGNAPVALQAVSAEGTVRQTLYPAPKVAASGATTVDVQMQFYRDIPQVFSLVLDYGLDGINTTLVQLSK
ncbi:hypothetical protein [Algirhabdus cladophorae]|uniref:hypothetical protein n=1 Tax=Algirhabdus cladophorae TaxID=3377108 RepID=UPI003B845FC5